MVIYEVNLVINTEIYEEFMAWLVKHVKEMVQFDGFLEAKVLLENSDTTENKKTTCCYLLNSRENLDNYLTNNASAMRQDGISRFGTKFSATRRVLNVAEVIVSTVNTDTEANPA